MQKFDTVILASANAGKIAELRALLDGCKVLGMQDFGAESPVEDGGSYAANAGIKVAAVRKAVGKRHNCLVLADDSGLEVDALEGAPGVETAHFGGWERLLEVLEGVPEGRRTARFKCLVMAADCDGGPVEVFEGACEGRISLEGRGEQGFGYDPVFVPAGETRTFAEMGRDEKKVFSHRGQAMDQFLAWAKGL